MKTRTLRSRSHVRGPGTRPALPSLEPILDREFSDYRDGHRWSFSEGKILLDGYDLNQLVSKPDVEIGTLLGVGGGLDDYRKRVALRARQNDRYAKFEAVAEAFLGKILGRLKRVYDQKTSGLAWSLQHGQLTLNGINVRSFLALYRVKKTEKARRFLEGLRQKLTLLLDNPENEKIRGLVLDLSDEIEGELSEKAARPARTLPPHRPGSY